MSKCDHDSGTGTSPIFTSALFSALGIIYCYQVNIILGVIVSGGYNGEDDMATNEVYFPTPGSGYTCLLQSLPSARSGHTLDQLGDGTVLACGGRHDTLNTCDKFNGTSWTQHSLLLYSRRYHTSLPGQHDLLLMGGQYSGVTTELVEGGEQYNLQQNTR